MSKRKLKKFFQSFSSTLALMEVFKEDKALTKKIVLAFIDEIEGLPLPVDWSKGKSEAHYWHEVYDIVYKLKSQQNSQQDSQLHHTTTLKEGLT
ncbi:hypothetical protein [Pampinifervens florentissimum]|uniref:hypothetical protein n=1 Tax=Pampinifervens florentissimum TaxID=1632019 RepID=UPI0013B49726|nr:hypothetical protein [Hydrogenobacter sp. T-8]QID34114.1 hypothetical protein G3M65_10145 [Hydrogenobacter sp. T-8]